MPTNVTSDSKRPTEKTAIYQTLNTLNEHFAQVLLDLGKLGKLGIFRSRFQRESLSTACATLEETRAWMNFEILQTLYDWEQGDRAAFGRVRIGFERKYEDPHDALLKAAALRKKIARAK
jgi:hypothetical protein